MVDTPPLTLILGICGIIFLAIGLPLALYYGMRKNSGPSTGEILGRASKGARQPWSEEDDLLAKLSNEAERIRRQNDENRDEDPPNSS